MVYLSEGLPRGSETGQPVSECSMVAGGGVRALGSQGLHPKDETNFPP